VAKPGNGDYYSDSLETASF